MKEDIVKLTKQWIERFVIGLKICPFAHYSFFGGTILLDTSENTKAKKCLADLKDFVLKLQACKADEFSNGFLLFDATKSFYFMLDLKEALDAFLVNEEMDEQFQTVVFHPDFQYGDEDYNSPSNFTNRSPAPMIHVLRVEEVATVIELNDNIDDIPKRNKEVLEAINIIEMSEIFADDFMDKIKPYI